MKRFFKKAVSLALCLVLLCGLVLPTLALDTAYPVIYIGDITENRLYKNPNTAKMNPELPPDDETMARYLITIVAGLVYPLIGGAANESTGLLLRGLNGLLGSIACDEYGNSEDDAIGVNTYRYPLSYYLDDPEVQKEVLVNVINACDTVGLDKTYLFAYDWRLDPLENAAKLNEFIAHVKSRTGASKVSLLCGGYGGIVANSYLYTYRTAAIRDLSSCVFLNSPLLGSSLAGDLMRGNLQQTLVDADSILDAYHTITGEERAAAFMRYMNDDPYGLFLSAFEDVFGESVYTYALSAGVVWIVNYFLSSDNMLSDVARSYGTFVVNQGDTIYDDCLHDVLCNMPGVWAMVPSVDMNDALAFMFPDNDMNARLEAKLNAYRSVVDATADTLRAVQSGGVNVCVVAGYNLQILPLTGTINKHSDCINLTEYASAGATCVNLSDATLDVVQKIDDNHNHLAPDSTVDASTCALPENTWFIRNLPNMQFTSQSAGAFVAWLLCADHQRTIWEEIQYPQYQNYSRGHKNIYALYNGQMVYFYGDTDVNGSVDASDARSALRHAVDLQPIPTHLGQILADVDGDGEITASDARIILRYSVGLEGEFDE